MPKTDNANDPLGRSRIVEKTELAAAMVKKPLVAFVRATIGYDTILLSAIMHYYT